MFKHTEELRILTDYRAVLDHALASGDKALAAEAVATMSQSLHMIALDVGNACAALTHSNGIYTPPLASISGMIERSSLGTPNARALRNTVSDERAAVVVARAAPLGGGE